MRKLILIPASGALIATLTGCGGISSRSATSPAAASPPRTTAQATSAQPTTAPAAPGDVSAPPGSDNPVAYGGPLDCNTVVDQGPPSVTAQQVISGLGEVSSLTAPTQADLATLNTAALDLKNYQGTVLANDTATFAADESSYGGMSGSGTVDTSYASTAMADIAALKKDCPAHTGG